MADQGSIARVASGVVPGVSGQRQAVNGSQPRSANSVAGTAGQGAGRRDLADGANRNFVNLDGKALNRAAPRGTYLNILV